jgi:hypothetical protein
MFALVQVRSLFLDDINPTTQLVLYCTAVLPRKEDMYLLLRDGKYFVNIGTKPCIIILPIFKRVRICMSILYTLQVFKPVSGRRNLFPTPIVCIHGN